MFSPSVVTTIIVVALAAHGIAHAIALGGLVGESLGGASASRVAVRSWIVSGLGADAAATVAILLWLVATVGFLLASLSLWGILVPDALWRQIAGAAAMASLVGIAFLAGTWPGSPTRLRSILNAGIAVTMDLAILLTLLWLHWPGQAMVGS